MSFQEKRAILTSISSILILGFYSLFVYNKYIVVNPEIINDLKFWGQSFLILIPVSIIAQIIIHILFAIVNKIVTNEEPEEKRDERDRLIELKAIRISHWVFILGFLLSMTSIAFGMPSYIMFIIIISSGFISSIANDIVKLILYKRGF